MCLYSVSYLKCLHNECPVFVLTQFVLRLYCVSYLFCVLYLYSLYEIMMCSVCTLFHIPAVVVLPPVCVLCSLHSVLRSLQRV